MKIGVSTGSFYPMEMEDACALLAGKGVKVMELFVNTPSDMKGAYLSHIRELREEYGLIFTSVHPFSCALEPILFFSEHKRRFEDGCDFYRRYFDFGAALQIPYFIFHGASIHDTGCSSQRYFERYSQLSRIAKEEFGVTLLQENVARCKSGSLTFLGQMKEQLPQARFALDLKQARRAGCSPGELVDLLGDRILHLHLSDCGQSGDCLIPFQGCFDFAAFFSRLRQACFSADAVIELYGCDETSVPHLLKSIQTFNGLLEGGNGGSEFVGL